MEAIFLKLKNSGELIGYVGMTACVLLEKSDYLKNKAFGLYILISLRWLVESLKSLPYWKDLYYKRKKAKVEILLGHARKSWNAEGIGCY